MPERDVFIISAVRTSIGSGKPTGALNSYQPVELAAAVLREAVQRAGIEAARVEDVILGVASPLPEGGAPHYDVARLAALRAGFPASVPGVQLNRMCGSGQQAIHFGAQAILAGDADLILAGGVEMMSHQPLGADNPGVGTGWAFSRDELDDYAYQSHVRAGRAIQRGYFGGQILPLPLADGRSFRVDEGVRQPPDRAWLAGLRPVLDENGIITVGNSPQGSDGAAVLLLASAQAVGRYNLMPMARIEARVVLGSDPAAMLDGPIAATRLALQRSGLSLEEMDVIEINEASAPLVLAWARELQADMEKVNPNGGSIAFGDPLGATGAILMTKLVYELERQRASFGLQIMWNGHGMATATIIERV